MMSLWLSAPLNLLCLTATLSPEERRKKQLLPCSWYLSKNNDFIYDDFRQGSIEEFKA
jgi:hypothetical protein